MNKPGGRPIHEASSDDRISFLAVVRDYLMDNPGAVSGRGKRRTYNSAFRRFLLEQMKVSKLTIEQASVAAGVPLGTLNSWLAARDEEPETMEPSEELDVDMPSIQVANPQLALILHEYKSWKGTFTAFCEHLKANHRIPYGKTFIANVLKSAGMRHKRRKKQPPAPWSGGTYETLFPGFQWVGDGKKLVIDVAGKLLAYNIEANIDPANGAVAGVTVTDTENEAAVIETFQKSLETTGKAPLAYTLDNKPSNHTKAVKEAVSPAVLLPSTPGRPTSKAPTEGAFGLFSQTAPELKIEGTRRREVGRSILQLYLEVWAWARNGKPRRKLGGLTPAEAYLSFSPTEEDIAKAKAYIRELQDRQEKSRRTREQRADPVRLRILKDELRILNIQDPDNRLAVSLAVYAKVAIIKGIAVFKTKKEAGTLPADVDEGRYLGGIIRNLSNKLELELFADNILELRLRLRELSLEPLKVKEAVLRNTTEPSDLHQKLVEMALTARPLLDFRFWMNKARDAMRVIAADGVRAIYTHLKRLISCSFDTVKCRREALLDAIADGLASATG